MVTTTIQTRRVVQLRLSREHKPFVATPYPFVGPPGVCASRTAHPAGSPEPKPTATSVVLVSLEPGDLLIDVPLCDACAAALPGAD